MASETLRSPNTLAPLAEEEKRPDPLASPTLAALLAFQGQAAAAEHLYQELGGVDQEALVDAIPGDRLLAALLAFRDAARRLRSIARSEE